MTNEFVGENILYYQELYLLKKVAAERLK